jgi:hypothetical protein
VYDNKENKFEFVEAGDLDKTKHKLVKNYLAFAENLLEINDISKINDDKYDYCLVINNEEVFSTSTHKFAVYNKETEYFQMVSCEDLNKEIHFIVNLSKNHLQR